jgi:group I intron endonuclease
MKNIIYKATNKEQKCFYIGYSSKGLDSRKQSHQYDCFRLEKKSKFYNFIRKYDWDNFTWEILAVHSTKEELPEAEKYWIKKQKEEFVNWKCLNSTDGGDGLLNPTKEIREKIGKGHKGKPLSKEIKNKLSTSLKGRLITQEHAKKISTALKGKKYSFERIKNMVEGRKKRNPNYGNPNPPKIKIKKPPRDISGSKNPNFGIKWTQEQKDAQAKRQLGKFTGEKNPRARKVILISPNGVEYNLPCYKPFCEQHKLNSSGITMVLRGQINQYKGWRGRYLENTK